MILTSVATLYYKTNRILKVILFLAFTALTIANCKAQGFDTTLKEMNAKWVTPVLATAYASSIFLSYKFLDQRLQDESQEGKSWVKTGLAQLANSFGVGKYHTIAVGTTAVVSLLIKNKRLQETSIIWLGSLAVNSVVTEQLKITFQRHRPNTGDPHDTFDWRGGSHLNKSFPSAHTSNAFTTATVFATLYKDEKWVPIVAYGIATLTGFSRIYNNAHWTSDVLAGAAVGFLSAKVVSGLYRRFSQKIVFLPSRSAHTTYFHLTYNL